MPRGTPKSLSQLISFGGRTFHVQIPTVCRPNTETILSLAVNHLLGSSMTSALFEA